MLFRSKEFKAIGGPDFAWKTSWLDIPTEIDLRNYREWTADFSFKDMAFYVELSKDVSIKCNELRLEFKDNNWKW